MGEKIATRQAYGKTLLELGKEYDEIVVLDADLSKSTMTAQFAAEYPDRFFNMGIAEQNMYGVASGMAASGKIVFASTFAIFAAGRAFEIIRNAIAYPMTNVKICATHAGLTVGEDGGSHQAIEDLSLMRTIPGMVVLNPSDAVSTDRLLRQMVQIQGPVYMRLGRAAVPVVYDADAKIEIGKGNCVREGTDVTIIATGVMLDEAIKAAEQLAEHGVFARVIDMHTIKPIDREIILKAARETRGIITAEEHTVIGGLGSAVAEVLCQEHPARMKIIGVRDSFGESGKPGELMEKYGLTAKQIVEAALTF